METEEMTREIEEMVEQEEMELREAEEAKEPNERKSSETVDGTEEPAQNWEEAEFGEAEAAEEEPAEESAGLEAEEPGEEFGEPEAEEPAEESAGLEVQEDTESDLEGQADADRRRWSEEAAQEADRDPEEGEGDVSRPDSLAFIESLLDERIVRAIQEMGFVKLSPIQEMAIPYLLDGDDIIGQAQTGTGKTAAFGIPALQKIDPDLKKLQTVILCPTRELAMQAAEELRKIAKYMHGIKVLPVYGGQDIVRQINGLKGVQIIVGTPGRVMDHMRRGTVKLDDVNMVVLDEADEMLDMGFREDMELILGQIPNAHQTALFSATMPKPILEIANKFQKDARLVKVAAKELTIPLVSQRYYRVKKQDKDAACIRLLEYYQPKLCLIFCNTKIKVDELAEVVRKAGFQVEGLHGDMSQHQRDVAMGRFRNGTTNILIATDVAARGIDVDNVEIVINYDLPQDTEYYVHRIGRTGRAGKTGRSFTFASNRELFRVRQIERFCHTTIEEKKLPGAGKVMKAKADIYLNRAWETHESEDMELMKSFLQRKLEEEDCDALELAAAMLKFQIGDMGPEIEEDDNMSGGRSDRRSRGDRDGRRRRDGDRDSRRRRDRDEDRDGRRRRDRDGDRDGRRRRDRDEERDERRAARSSEGREKETHEDGRSYERREDGRGWETPAYAEGRRSRDREERRDDVRDWNREERRDSERSRSREEGRDGGRDWDREERRDSERSRSREEGRDGGRDWDRRERRDSERSRSREEGWDGGRDWDREEGRKGRNRKERREEERSRSREERRDSERSRSREERRDSGRGWEREVRDDRRRGHEREDKRSSRRKDDRRESNDSRRKEERSSRRSKVRDVRLDGSERGIAFSFPKKKRK